MLDPVQILQAKAQTAAAIRLTIERSEIENVMEPAIAALLAPLVPDLRERYLAGPESNPDPATRRTELNRGLLACAPISRDERLLDAAIRNQPHEGHEYVNGTGDPGRYK